MADQYQIEDDKWFDWKGAKKPERTPHGVTDEELATRLKENISGHECEWQQEGTDLFCTAGGFRHGRIVSPDLRLINGKLVKLRPQYRK